MKKAFETGIASYEAFSKRFDWNKPWLNSTTGFMNGHVGENYWVQADLNDTYYIRMIYLKKRGDEICCKDRVISTFNVSYYSNNTWTNYGLILTG